MSPFLPTPRGAFVLLLSAGCLLAVWLVAAPLWATPPHSAEEWYELALENLRRDAYAEAREGFERSLALYRASGNLQAQADPHIRLCFVLHKMGELEEALACSQRARALLRRLGDTDGEAKILLNVAGVRSKQGENAAELAAYDEALELFRASDNHRGEAMALNNLGAAYRKLGEYEDAHLSYRLALETFRQIGDLYWQARVLNNLGYFFLDLGDLEAARGRLEEALALRRAVGDRRGEIVTLRNLARVDQLLGRHRDAVTQIHLALTLARETDNRRGEALARMLQGEAQIALGQPEGARAAFDAALSLQREIGNQRLAAEALLQLGEAGLRMGESTAARWHEAAELFRETSEPAGEAQALYGAARAALRRGREEQARSDLEAALALIEGQRPRIADATQRTTFLAARRGIYELHVLLLMRRHRADPEDGFAAAALEASERARARALLEVVTGTLGRRGAEAAPPPTASADEIRAALEPRTVLLEYLLGEARVVLWLVRRDGVEAFDLPPRREIETLARRAHADLSAVDLRTGTTANEALSALGNLVLGPVAERLEGAQRIVAVADGALHLVPFAALPDPGVAGAPLVLRHEVVQLPSASVLLAQRGAPRRTARRTLALFADPVFGPGDPRLGGAEQVASRPADDGATGLISATRAATDLGAELARLPHTRREAEAIAALVPAQQRLTAFGFEAKRQRVLGDALAGYRIVHFATHGLVNPRRPELSGLVLSQLDASGRRRDGFLRLADVAALELDAELVVLSGCRTALGREVRGAGLLGLVRGFMVAGVPRVVASLWPVEDRATAELMAHFYRALLEGGETPASALRAAQLALRGERRWADPYFWGAFVLQGDWR